MDEKVDYDYHGFIMKPPSDGSIRRMVKIEFTQRTLVDWLAFLGGLSVILSVYILMSKIYLRSELWSREAIKILKDDFQPL